MRPLKLLTTAYIALLGFWAVASYYELSKLHFQRWPLADDFVKFYTCGLLSMQAHHLQIYDPKTQADMFIGATMKYNMAPSFQPYIQYFPVTFVLVTPFSWLPMKGAFVVWSVVAPLVALPLLWKACERFGSIKYCIALAIALFASVPAYHNYWFGQLAWFYLAILSGIWISFVHGREVALGCTLALSVIKPQYAIFLFPMIFFKQQKTAFVSCAIAGIVLLAITTAVLGIDNLLAYPHALHFAETEWQQISGLNGDYMIGLRGLLSLFLPQDVALPLNAVAAICGIAGCWFIWRRAHRLSSDQSSDIYSWAMALTIVVSIAVGVHEREYDLMLLGLPAAITLGHTAKAGENKHALLVWKAILIALPAVTWLAFLFLYPIKMYSPAVTLLVFVLLVSGLKYYLTSSPPQ